MPRTARAALTVLAFALVAALAGCGNSKDEGSANAVDRAFVRQMIPHHESAVEMARTALGEARHRELETGLAPSIVRTQRAEIAKMQAIARGLGVTPAAMHSDAMAGHGSDADAKALGLRPDAMGMSMRMADLEGAKPFDRAFIDMMIPHHQGAIRMARAELARGKDQRLKAIAQAIVGAQTKEIGQMNDWRMRWYGAASPAGGIPAA